MYIGFKGSGLLRLVGIGLTALAAVFMALADTKDMQQEVHDTITELVKEKQ